jgi:hypothetical protein
VGAFLFYAGAEPATSKKGPPKSPKDFLGKGGAAKRMSFRESKCYKTRKRLSAARDDAVQILPPQPEELTHHRWVSSFLWCEPGINLTAQVMRPKGEYPEGEAVLNDSPADCQIRRTDRSIFIAMKMQDRGSNPASATKGNHSPSGG